MYMTIETLEKMTKFIEMTESCWLWQGWKNDDGYAKFRKYRKNYRKLQAEGKKSRDNYNVHRTIYELINGKVATKELDHTCRIRHCVNPKHLEPVDTYENQKRSPITQMNKTHCIRGHEFTEENTRRFQNNSGGISRQCKACIRFLYHMRKRG